MKIRTIWFTILSGFVLLIMASCSAGDSLNQSPVTSDFTDAEIALHVGVDSGRYLWGAFEILYDRTNDSVTVTPIRIAAGHWNILSFLEQGPCVNCVQVIGVVDSGNGTTLFDIKITHPFASKTFTGFDVRGIAMFAGSQGFPATSLTSPNRYLGDGELVNADGYTSLYNITTQGSGPGGLQGYEKGKFAGLLGPSAALNGFKRHSSPGAANTRNMFYAGESVVATYDLDMPDTVFAFGYAIDASWVPPSTKPVTDPKTNFPPEANSPEPWKIEISNITNTLSDLGGSVDLIIDVYDYQGKNTHSSPVISCPSVFSGTINSSWSEDGDGYTRYTASFDNDLMPSTGIHKCLISVEDDENASSPAWLDLSAYHVIDIEVEAAGWAYAWGDFGEDWGYSVVTDDEGNVYVAGGFSGTVDFDPTFEVDEFTFDSGAFVSKFTPFGDYVWTRAWGGDYCVAYDIAIDPLGNLYITGDHVGAVDFDPGPFEHVLLGSQSYLSKLDSNGMFEWAWDWSANFSLDVAVDGSDYVYVSGRFNVAGEFAPGVPIDLHDSHGQSDAYVSRFLSDGTYVGVKIIGGTGIDAAWGLDVDGFGNVYIAGNYASIVDFDTGAGSDQHTSNGSRDCFLTVYDGNFDYKWTSTWGGEDFDIANEVKVQPNGTSAVTGGFRDIVDFDTSQDDDNHSAVGGTDAFLTLFNVQGDFLWAETWGGVFTDHGQSLIFDDIGRTYVVGTFAGTADLDPGGGVDEHQTAGFQDIFLSHFGTGGTLRWARSWGGTDNDFSYGVALAPVGSYVTGVFQSTVDFDPGDDVWELDSNGANDAFITRFGEGGAW